MMQDTKTRGERKWVGFRGDNDVCKTHLPAASPVRVLTAVFSADFFSADGPILAYF